MNTDERYKELNRIRNNKELWESSIDEVGSLLEKQPQRIKAKALWMLGEMGLLYPTQTGYSIYRKFNRSFGK